MSSAGEHPSFVMPPSWMVHKFGGTSVGSADRYQNVATLVLQSAATAPARLAVVVSAMAGVTDSLFASCTEAAAAFHVRKKTPHKDEKAGYLSLTGRIHDKHIQTVQTLAAAGDFSAEDAAAFQSTLERDIEDIKDILKAVSITGTCPETMKELITGYGELWSAQLLRALLRERVHKAGEGRQVEWIDARDILTVQDPSSRSGSMSVHERVLLDFPKSQKHMDKWMETHPDVDIVVVTGYICSTQSGTPTTLKRNGSDYSASLLSALLKASKLVIWTDVDGVYTADPRKVPAAFRLPFVSYTEAIELAYFGAKVLHPFTMHPCIQHSIPIHLRSSLRPESSGTLISNHRSQVVSPLCAPSSPPNAANVNGSKHDGECDGPHTDDFTLMDVSPCKAFTMIADITLVTLEGSSMIGVPGIASRLFAAVNEASCSVVMISQASSEHSISFAVVSRDAQRAADAVRNAFYKEMHEKSMSVTLTSKCTIICAVGENMCGSRGILGRLATAFAVAGVNIIAVTQGCSENNITFVVSSSEAVSGLRAIHDAVYGKETPRIPSRLASAPTRIDMPPLILEPNTTETVPVVVLVPELPVPQLAQDSVLHQIVKMLSPVEVASDGKDESHYALPLSLTAFTDGQSHVASYTEPQVDQALPPLPATDLLRSMPPSALLFDIRSHLKRLYSPTTEKAERVSQHTQDTFLQRWKQTGRMVVNRQGIQCGDAVNTLLRILKGQWHDKDIPVHHEQHPAAGRGGKAKSGRQRSRSYGGGELHPSSSTQPKDNKPSSKAAAAAAAGGGGGGGHGGHGHGHGHGHGGHQVWQKKVSYDSEDVPHAEGGERQGEREGEGAGK
ncbi:unnamed protein product [Vitrella brassicaformis CCMP3155]|uniref:aspartate kinase n=4 Tax=Vitrella brassicaformis TaxID=1169539 RepID=A0A0G4FCV3_VITBC|nr:unnamed protein product [Vitrella brassicaformis CCMP3155]|eukprot:CEM10747.1 unnamed protein product [Vitrella brassicaformis CCMP3155]